MEVVYQSDIYMHEKAASLRNLLEILFNSGISDKTVVEQFRYELQQLYPNNKEYYAAFPYIEDGPSQWTHTIYFRILRAGRCDIFYGSLFSNSGC